LFPAGWEALDAPTSAECVADYGKPKPSSTSTYRPLIYAVGAVDDHASPLSITRPKSLPRIVAPGSHLASFDGSPGLMPVSGTSSATAIVSAAATVVRTIRPTMTAHDVMQALRDGGEDSGLGADFCHSGTCGTARIVSVCSALEQACGTNAGCLANLPSAGCSDSSAWSVLTTSPGSADVVTPEYDTDEVGTCGDADDYFSDPEETAYDVACPVQELESASALAIVRPMPPKDVCPWCPAVASDPVTGSLPSVRIALTEDASNLGNMTITVLRNGLQPEHYMVPPFSGNEQVVELPEDAFDDRSSIPVTGVTFDYTYGSEPFAYSEPLILEF
jgi:hypothetical protein